jgi:electron transport complex protein RnfB
MKPEIGKKPSRRDFLRTCGRSVMLGTLGAVTGTYLFRRQKAVADTHKAVWQLDPKKCIQCGQCATHCVLNPSAVKCVHTFSMCGYCDLCFGYFRPEAKVRNEAAENQLCPTGAIRRAFVEEPYFEYSIDESLCIGCGKCVKGCNSFGNGSLYLQVRSDYCLNCNDCAIARACPANAFYRLPAKKAYLPRA